MLHCCAGAALSGTPTTTAGKNPCDELEPRNEKAPKHGEDREPSSRVTSCWRRAAQSGEGVAGIDPDEMSKRASPVASRRRTRGAARDRGPGEEPNCSAVAWASQSQSTKR
jgi:hypothetical protein